MTKDLHEAIAGQLHDGKRFQQLTEEDHSIYGAPELIRLAPPRKRVEP